MFLNPSSRCRDEFPSLTRPCRRNNLRQRPRSQFQRVPRARGAHQQAARRRPRRQTHCLKAVVQEQQVQREPNADGVDRRHARQPQPRPRSQRAPAQHAPPFPPPALGPCDDRDGPPRR